MLRFISLLIALLPIGALAQSSHGEMLAPGQFTTETAPHQRDIAMTCSFTSECFETENCADTAFETTLSGKAGGLTPSDMVVQAKWITDAETQDLVGVLSGDVLALSGGSFAARSLLTVAPSGARLSVHLADGPMVITYHGSCEAPS